MNYRSSFFIVAGSLLCTFVAQIAAAQESLPLKEWTAKAAVVEGLGEVFADDQISIRLPKDLQKVEQEASPEKEKLGVYNYGFAPNGIPALEHMTITLTPYAKPSSDALDKTVEGMQGVVQKGLPEVEFGPIRKGMFLGFEARAGRYTANINGEKVSAFYLIGIDQTGTYAITAMLPTSLETPEKVSAAKAALLTFQRVK